MSKTYRPYDRDQMLLLPPTVQEWVPKGDRAHLIDDLVETLDISTKESVYEEELRGYPPYHPKMMTKLWLYGYSVGVCSSRRLATLATRDVGVVMLAAGNRPDFRTLSEFRRRHLSALAELFTQVVQVCAKKGLVELREVSVDGTKITANASKHAAMSYSRMKPEVERIEKEIAQWLAKGDDVDREEDTEFGANVRGDELPEELQTAHKRKEAIKAAMKELEEEAAAAKKEAPDPTAQKNFTDPQSRIMKGPDGFIQGYNAQAAVDAKSQVIVGHLVTQKGNDVQQLVPVVEVVKEVTGQTPTRVLADAGYCSEDNMTAMEKEGIDAYLAPGRMPRSYRWPAAPRGRIRADATPRERMKRKLLTKKGKEIYHKRQETVEPVFGQIKNKGLQRFLLRGLTKVQGEWALHAIGHNITKLEAVWG